MNDFDDKARSEAARSRKEAIRLLVVDDSAADVELMTSMLRRAGLTFTFDSVDLPATFEERLRQDSWDVILSDHNLRTWIAMDALRILRGSGKDIPFIVVTGTLGDERAVEYLRNGASDYVLKENLEKLPSTILRALEEKAQRDENRRLQDEIRKSKEDWERTFNAIPDSIMLLDRDGRIIRANAATAGLVGTQDREIIGEPCYSVVHGSLCRVADCPFQKMLSSGEEAEAEIVEHRLNRILQVSTIPFRDEAGNLEGAVHVMRDITERKHFEEEMLQARKMEAIGRLAGGVAHDFNNILGIIRGYAELMQERVPPDDPVLRQQLGEISKATGRAAGVTRQLLAFSRKQMMQLKPVKLNELVTEMGQMLRALIGENIDLIINPADNLGTIKADPVQVQQVLMNLAINARDAMSHGGKLTITTSNVELDASYPRINEPVRPGSYVMIAVSDTGVGMDPETSAHIFEPFFTTKPQGEGTGFGLSIVYGIVKQSGGYIWVYSELGHGTSFKIYFPHIAEEVAVVVPIAPAMSQPASYGTILLVEDEEALADMIHAILNNKGYAVLHASTGEDALQTARRYQGQIDLMLTDIILRGTMDGIELARRLPELRPQTKVLFMSGYADALTRAGCDLDILLLEKPFTNEELLARIRDALEGKPPANPAYSWIRRREMGM